MPAMPGVAHAAVPLHAEEPVPAWAQAPVSGVCETGLVQEVTPFVVVHEELAKQVI